jgi:gamma-butyrobetaine dioxygenase
MRFVKVTHSVGVQFEWRHFPPQLCGLAAAPHQIRSAISISTVSDAGAKKTAKVSDVAVNVGGITTEANGQARDSDTEKKSASPKQQARWLQEIAAKLGVTDATANGSNDRSAHVEVRKNSSELEEYPKKNGKRVLYSELPSKAYARGFKRPLYKTPKSIDNKPHNLVAIGGHLFHPVFLRDACACPQCVDLSSKQKIIQTTDIPLDIGARSVDYENDGTVNIKWNKDLPGFGKDHVSSFPKRFSEVYSSWAGIVRDRHLEGTWTKPWNKDEITKRLEFVNYDEYMTTDQGLWTALKSLHSFGLLLVRDVPESETAVEEIATRIGRLRDTFYGRTWDVKSVPQAKNVAYTAQYLGLHMDLLYMANPPGFQFLHCLKNTCEGGSSIFSDTFKAAAKLPPKDFEILCQSWIPYHYRNAGEHYFFRHPVIEAKQYPRSLQTRIININYSPPFQAPLAFLKTSQEAHFPPFLRSFKKLASQVESEENLYEYRLQEGECVIFNNRRVLHGRRQFDTSAGERWLKGCYIDTDVFQSRFRVMAEKADQETIGGKRQKVHSELTPLPDSGPEHAKEIA